MLPVSTHLCASAFAYPWLTKSSYLNKTLSLSLTLCLCLSVCFSVSVLEYPFNFASLKRRHRSSHLKRQTCWVLLAKSTRHIVLLKYIREPHHISPQIIKRQLTSTAANCSIAGVLSLNIHDDISGIVI